MIDPNSTDYCLEDLLLFCKERGFDELKTWCYLDSYRSPQARKKEKTVFWFFEFCVENLHYPMEKQIAEHGSLLDCHPYEPPRKRDSMEKVIEDIIRLEKSGRKGPRNG